ncbi:MAG: hypothetical protein HYU52_16490, partial [Acidobacteria bacterium]|nr:hypothetical protein [Acidobacteriota bacterium]
VALGITGAASLVAGSAIVPSKSYSIATTDYLVKASPYRDLVAELIIVDTGANVRSEVRERIASGR